MTLNHDDDPSPIYYHNFKKKTSPSSSTTTTTTATNLPSLANVGGKVLSLIHATRSGFPVPEGFVLTTSFFSKWMKQIESTKEWDNFLTTVKGDDDNNEKKIDQIVVEYKEEEDNDNNDNDKDNILLRDICSKLKKRCHENLVFDKEQKLVLNKAFNETFFFGGFDNNNNDESESSSTRVDIDNVLFVAVRSSSPEEDLIGHSFAGGYETTLGVKVSSSSFLSSSSKSSSSNETKDDIPIELFNAILLSFASAFDYRVVQYKKQKKMSLENVPQMAVIIQKQINSYVSGVAFTVNPYNNCYDEIVVTANFGLGETVVSGLVTPDIYIVDRVMNCILSKKIGKKNVSHRLVVDDAEEGGGGGGGGIIHVEKIEIEESEVQALTDEQILQVSFLACKVENDFDGRPVDIEWAINSNSSSSGVAGAGASGDSSDNEGGGGELYLLQARSITTYIPLFPELVTSPGAQKKLYLDVIAMTQGFSDPLSVLGMDIWSRMIIAAKPHLTHGKDGMIYEIHGREYMNLSNLLSTTGGTFLLKKMITMSADGVTRDAIESINVKEYTPLETPPKSKFFIWKTLYRTLEMLPTITRGTLNGEDALKEYLSWVDETMARCGSKSSLNADENETECNNVSFGDEVEDLMAKFAEVTSKVGAIVAPLISRWRLHRMFAGEKDMQDLLINLNMDLKGNPTSEMGHLMLRLASMNEIQETHTSNEFVQRLKNNTYSTNLCELYESYMKKFGCRCMKEIDIATPRTYEQQDDFFHRIKQINIKDNAILTVKARKDEAYQKLLTRSIELGKEDKFRFHANTIKQLGGYREHPKYMFVVMVAYLRRLALKVGSKLVKEERLQNVNQIFDLTVNQIDMAEKNSEANLVSLVRQNTAPYEKVKHVNVWPSLIDSRGKIIRAAKHRREEEDNKRSCHGEYYGDPISPGIVQGRAKVLNTPYEKSLNRGEILVTRATEPSWTPIFINANGVVLEVGGPLQHGAIIAREYGIPCVSGVEHATNRIRDGQLLELDGTNGFIKVLEEEEDEEEEKRVDDEEEEE